jgi:hypothetical protein
MRLQVLLLVLRQVLSPVRLPVLGRMRFQVQLLIFLRYPVQMCPPRRSFVMLMTTETATTAPADASFTTLRVTSFVVRPIQQKTNPASIIAWVRPLERLAGQIPSAKARSVLAEFAKTAFRYRGYKAREKGTEKNVRQDNLAKIKGPFLYILRQVCRTHTILSQ